MILQLSPFFSIVVLSLAMRCKEVVNGFHCKRNTESISLPQSELEQCNNTDGEVVCMHSFKFGSDVFELSKVEPQIITNGLKQCVNLTSEYHVFCDKNDCEVDAIAASKRCELKSVQLCGGIVQKSEDINDQFAACMIVFKPPPVAPHSYRIDEWHRVESESGKMAKTNNYEECGWNEDRLNVKIFCYEDGCDKQSNEKLLRDTFKGQTIICNDIGYIINGQELECPERQKSAACAVKIQIVNGFITRSTSLSIESSSEPGNHCSSVNVTTQSFVSVCHGDNCDKIPEEMHAKTCKVNLFQCGTKYHFLYQIKNKVYCVFTAVLKGDNYTITVKFEPMAKPIKSGCDRRNLIFYCEKNCEYQTGRDNLVNCITKKEEVDEQEEDTLEQKSRSRLIINITMVVVFLLIATAVFSGGLIASEPEDPPIEVKKERKKKEGKTKTGGTSVTGQTTVKTKTTTKRSTPDV